MIEKLINSIESASEIEYTLNDGLIDEGYFAIIVVHNHQTIFAYWADIKELSIEDFDAMTLYDKMNHREQNEFVKYIENRFNIKINDVI